MTSVQHAANDFIGVDVKFEEVREKLSVQISKQRSQRKTLIIFTTLLYRLLLCK